MSLNEENCNMVAIGCAAIIMAELERKKKEKKNRKRRYWESDLFKKRTTTGEELLHMLKAQELSGQYKNFVRMSSTDFENLLQKIGPHITKQETHLRSPISAQDRLAVTLRFLATGDSYSSLQYLFRISRQSIGNIVRSVCAALVAELKEYIKLPANSAEWKGVSETFNAQWNLPHCIGALDGKHVVLQAPNNSGTEFFNYKSSFSIVLFALVDADYNFMFADVGCQGRISDGGVFQATKLYSMLQNNALNLPPPEKLPGRSMELPYFFAVDSAFSLSDNLMKPYPGDHAKGTRQRIFNYRLSRGRRVVENAFGISSAVFRVLRKPILLAPETAEAIVMTTMLLHNYLKANSPNIYVPVGSLDRYENGILLEGSWRNENFESMPRVRNFPQRGSNQQQKIRDELADYFINEGRVEWQDNYC